MYRVLIAALIAFVGCSGAALADGKALLEQCKQARRAGSFEEAAQLCTRALAARDLPADSLPVAHNVRGLAYYRLDQYDLAIKDFDAAINLDDSEPGYFDNRGSVYLALKQYDRAIADFDRALHLDPTDPIILADRGMANRAKGDLEAAIRDYTASIASNPRIGRIYNNRGNAYRDHGDYDLAIKDYDQAIEFDPMDARLYNNRAGAYDDKGDVDQAIADYTRAIVLDPDLAYAYMDRGDLLNKKGEFEKGLADGTRGVALDPDDSLGWWAKGVAEFGLARYKTAATTLAGYVELEPEYAYGVLLLYLAQARAGATDVATLRANAKRLDLSEWPGPIFRYLLGEVSEQDVSININNVKDTICDRSFYLGQGALLAGSKIDARRYFEAAAEYCPETLVEKAIAQAELSRLSQ